MSSRKGVEEGRSQGDPGTRTRILASAWRLVLKRGVAAATIGAIARAARVSRQAVYLHFGDRAGVLVAMVRHHDETHDVPRRFAAIRAMPSAADALEAYTREWCAYVPDILPVARALEAAALTDEGARAAWNDRMNAVRRGVAPIIERLAADGGLREPWTTAEAAAWCWSQLHIDNWQHLVVEVGWLPSTYVERLISTLRATLVKPRRSRRPAKRV